MRDSFCDFAERTGTVLLVPLFSVGAAADDVHGFKWIDAHEVRYDLLLLDMIELAAEFRPLATNRFALFGYSGGGQFAHRFLYLHPHRLTALSIGAPGNVTLPDFVRPWSAGLRGLEERFGVEFNADAVQAVPIHLVVGGADTETWEIARSPDDPVYVGGVNGLRPSISDSVHMCCPFNWLRHMRISTKHLHRPESRHCRPFQIA